MNLLNSHSCLENIDLIEHNNEILEIINLLEGYYDYDCALVCKFQDELNKIRKNRAKIHELRTLFWECTLRCNASCLHCGSDCHVSSAHPDMPVEDFLKVIDEITPHVDPHKVMITFTGGEALVRKDIEACGRELNKREYPWGIVSNGLLLNRTRLDSLLAAGMHSITISLDGFEEAHNWLRGNRRSFEGAVNRGSRRSARRRRCCRTSAGSARTASLRP